MKGRRLLCVTMCAALAWLGRGGAPDAWAQSPKPGAADVWSTAVEAYIDGRPVEAALTALGIDERSVPAIVRRAADGWQAEGSARAAKRLMAGAALLLEIALEQSNAGDVPTASRFLEAGSEVLRRIEANPRGRVPEGSAAAADWRAPTFAAVWRLNHLQFLLQTRQFSQVERLAQRSDLDALPDHLRAEWHLTRGVARETLARVWLESDARGVMSVFVGRPGGSRSSWVDGNLDDAARHYRAALREAPTQVEATLRLGRVLLERGAIDEARLLLDSVVGEPCQDAVCGMAALFVGELHDARDDLAEATRAYVLASSIPELRQSALVGLLRVSLRQASPAAPDVVRRFRTDTTSADVPDAWGRYTMGHFMRQPRAAAALREEVYR